MKQYDREAAAGRVAAYFEGAFQPETLARVFDFTGPMVFEKGQSIFGDAQAFFLVEGVVRGFYLDRDGNDITHIFILENQLHRPGFLTAEKPHVCDFEALEDCVAVRADMERLAAATLDTPALTLRYVHELEMALSRKIRRETSLVTQSATERYLDLLRHYPGIERRVSQMHIASYLGINPASLSRIRRVIREEQ